MADNRDCIRKCESDRVVAVKHRLCKAHDARPIVTDVPWSVHVYVGHIHELY